MKSKINKSTKFVALLRGINVGGHHKLPMAALCNEMKQLGFLNISTLLNSGNVIFDAEKNEADKFEITIAKQLEKTFGFPVPVLIRTADEMFEIGMLDPFKNISVTKETRLYVSFLKQKSAKNIKLPWFTEDKSFQIIYSKGQTICSVLDLAIANTPKGMDAMEQLFGKDITTRNWNTVNKIIDVLKK